MYKLFIILAVLVLLGSYPSHVGAQETGDKSKTQTNIPNNPVNSGPTKMPAPANGNAEAEGLYKAGIKLTEAGQFSEAVENLQQALRVDPQYADAYAALGRAYFKLREWDMAVVNLRRAAELNARLKAPAKAAGARRLSRNFPASRQRRTETSIAAAKVTPTSPEIKLPQQTTANVASVKTVSPESETRRQPEQRQEVSTPPPAITSTPQIKLPQQTNANLAAVKSSSTKSETRRQPEQRQEVSTPAQAITSTPQIKLPQQTNANVAAVKSPSPKLETTRQPEQREEVSVSGRAITSTLQIKLPQPTNANVAAVKLPSPELATTGRPTQLEEIGPPPAITTTPQIKLPQQANVDAAGVKPFTPELEKARQPKQREEISAPARATSTTPEIKLPQANANVAPLRLPTPELATTGQPTQLEDIGPPPAITTTPQINLPQQTNVDAAGVKPLTPELKKARQSEQREEISTPPPAIATTAQIKVPQQTNGDAADVKPLSPESETTRQPEQAADDVPVLRTGSENALEQKQELVGSQVSMALNPPPLPSEIKSVIPSSIKASGDGAAPTKIYRIGPRDVLDVRINDSQSPRSTLSTVSPSGFLEHPMLTEPLLVTGFTAEEVAAKIELELSRRALLAKVTVGVRDYASHSVLVSGLVKDAGTKFLRREAIPLYVVVADAQPLPEAAKVTVVRNEPSQTYEIDLTQPAEMNLLVRPGDVITLHRNTTQFIYIGGEVKVPGEKTFRRGLTLTQAIISSGVTPKSKRAEIGRDDGRGFLVETSFILKDIQSGKAVDPLLQPGDRIMVLR